MTGLAVDIVRKIMAFWTALEAMLKLYEIPKSTQAVFAFFYRNMERFDNEEWLSTLHWKKDTGIESVTVRTTELIWIALALGREVNIIRHAYGRAKVDFIAEATTYDKETSQQQGIETDQAGEDESLSKETSQ